MHDIYASILVVHDFEIDTYFKLESRQTIYITMDYHDPARVRLCLLICYHAVIPYMWQYMKRIHLISTSAVRLSSSECEQSWHLSVCAGWGAEKTQRCLLSDLSDGPLAVPSDVNEWPFALAPSGGAALLREQWAVGCQSERMSLCDTELTVTEGDGQPGVDSFHMLGPLSLSVPSLSLSVCVSVSVSVSVSVLEKPGPLSVLFRKIMNGLNCTLKCCISPRPINVVLAINLTSILLCLQCIFAFISLSRLTHTVKIVACVKVTSEGRAACRRPVSRCRGDHRHAPSRSITLSAYSASSEITDRHASPAQHTLPQHGAIRQHIHRPAAHVSTSVTSVVLV